MDQVEIRELSEFAKEVERHGYQALIKTVSSPKIPSFISCTNKLWTALVTDYDRLKVMLTQGSNYVTGNPGDGYIKDTPGLKQQILDNFETFSMNMTPLFNGLSQPECVKMSRMFPTVLEAVLINNSELYDEQALDNFETVIDDFAVELGVRWDNLEIDNSKFNLMRNLHRILKTREIHFDLTETDLCHNLNMLVQDAAEEWYILTCDSSIDQDEVFYLADSMEDFMFVISMFKVWSTDLVSDYLIELLVKEIYREPEVKVDIDNMKQLWHRAEVLVSITNQE